MELNFKTVKLNDKQKITEIFNSANRIFCENTFGNLFCWQFASGYKAAFVGGGMIIGNPERQVFDFPVGDCDKAEVIKALMQKYKNLRIRCMTSDDANILKDIGGFEITEDTSHFDYIYESQKLITLSGKKLAAKRNHINAFLAEGEYFTRPITSSDKQLLLEFNKKWCENKCGAKNSGVSIELCAAERALENFESLGLLGLMLFKNNTLVAYSYGEPISKNVFCVHVEKADADVRGAYQMINREFAREYCKNYQYINREDDAGDEGIKKAKLSYYPTQLGIKFKAELKK